MKRLCIFLLATYAVVLFCYADRQVSYARINQKVTLDLNWSAANYGDVVWQISDDNGLSWQDIESASGHSVSFQATSPTALYRAVIKGDPSCPPIIQEREIRTIDFKSEVVSNTATMAELEISSLEFGDAEIVEYGFTSALNGMGRTYSILPRTKVGERLPEEDSFIIPCTGLSPTTQYSLRPYFKTADGSLIFGAGKLVTTLEGPVFDMRKIRASTILRHLHRLAELLHKI